MLLTYSGMKRGRGHQWGGIDDLLLQRQQLHHPLNF
jgi:hypothetical protein